MGDPEKDTVPNDGCRKSYTCIVLIAGGIFASIGLGMFEIISKFV